MARIIPFFLFVLSAWAQSVPVISIAGPLSCGLRLYQPGQVQTYCFYLPPAGGAAVTVCNALDEVVPATAGVLPVEASHSCFATDTAGGNNYLVSWIVWEPIVAIPPGSTGNILYQIAVTTMPCTYNATAGVCVQTPGAPAPTQFQQGSIPSGIVGIARVLPFILNRRLFYAAQF